MEVLRINLFEFAMSLSGITDLISILLSNHHNRVSYIAYSLANEIGLSTGEKQDIILAGALHDLGALSLKQRIDTLQFEMLNPFPHAETGYLLLKEFPFFTNVAQIVRSHHHPWNHGSDAEITGISSPIGSHILHISDRIDILIDRGEQIFGQLSEICEKITKHSGVMFMPDLVSAFESLAKKEYFWLDIVSPSIEKVLSRRAGCPEIELDTAGFLHLSKIFSKIIDFRSHFTNTHSTGVAYSAEALARIIGFPEDQLTLIRVAGFLHDLGKLSVPAEILEKHGRLSPAEISVIKGHTYHTYRILDNLEPLAIIKQWASYHHERLDGKGYPFQVAGNDLPLGSRIIAVADVFTALAEDRPYRKGMHEEEVLKILDNMAGKALDPEIVSLLRINYNECNSRRIAAQQAVDDEYRHMISRR
jgi:HD-GYP domain-containing protein (c-di-GMP phosphodiesterase class II)